MKGQIRGLIQASRNTQDTLSMLQTSDGGMDEVAHILHRMRELSVQSLNDTLTDEDRTLVNLEFKELKYEIDRISTDTKFNTKQVYEEHDSIYQEVSGNKVLHSPVSVIAGYNDKLKLTLDEVEKTIEVKFPAGKYTNNQLVDELNKQLEDQGIYYVKTQISGVNTGTNVSDSDKLVLKALKKVMEII